ncbi:butyrophilin subfamily 3 member A2-like [Tiliqua scincoides]|uniref:butyrophilin subfamily 3 member A2-like n=1 Tax=Tiliqua scincoides TaxID=71010 RepID=UPI0034637476
MCFSATAVFIWTVLQISQVAGHFAIIPPKNPVIGFLGEDVILPCQLITASNPESASIRVQWTFSTFSEKIDVKSYYGAKKEETQDRRYQNRTELFYTELRTGNMSLKLKNSRLSDQGKYSCTITLGKWPEEVDVELKLAANGVEPTISLELYQDWGIGLTCSSQGWYPRSPVLLWMNSEERNRTEKVESSKTEQEPGGTFRVSSSITIEPGGDNGVSCKIINSVLQSESESRILISDVFYPTTNPWLPPFIIILLIDLCLVAFVAYKLIESYQNISPSVKKKNVIQIERLHLEGAIEMNRHTRQAGGFEEQKQLIDRVKVELDFRRAQSYAAAVTLDPDHKHPELIISEDQKKIRLQPSTAEKPVTCSGTPVVVGKEGYEAGKHYWEVKVGGRLDWELGVLTQVARDKVRKEKFSGPLGEGCWALRSSREGFFTRQDGEKIKKRDVVPHKMIGMFLDQEEGKITFYNAYVGFMIHSIPIQSNERLHPFLSFVQAAEDADQSPLELIHCRAPVPLKAL